MANLLGWRMPAKRVLEDTFSPELIHEISTKKLCKQARTFYWFVEYEVWIITGVALQNTAPESAEHFLCNGSQMNPARVEVAYTAFSPLRAFLWAAFQVTIFTNVPSKKVSNFLSQTWKCRGRTYQGVAVFAFYISTPAPSHLSRVTLPEEKPHGFQARVDVMNSTDNPRCGFWNPEDAWIALWSTIRNTDSTWPDILHSAESNEQKQLGAFQCNMWRTCWLQGQGLDALNRGYRYTMAVTFVAIPASVAALKASALVFEEDKDKGRDKKPWRKSFHHKMSKFLLCS